MTKKIFKYLFLILIVAAFAIAVWLRASEASVHSLPPLQSGDLLFQTTPIYQALGVMAASYSPYSHVGIAKVDGMGKVFVIEAAGPVREIPLDDWINQGWAKRVTVKRMQDLTPDQAKKVLAAAKKYYGLPYDFLFQFDKEKLYCSELVYYAFKEGPQIAIGREQAVQELHVDNFAVRDLIRERWQSHPVCKQQGAKDYQACYNIIMQQKLVTPQSVADDSKLNLVYTNYGWLAQ